MAAALMRHRLSQMGLSDHISVKSAGVWATAGHTASANAIAVLSTQGIDLTPHRSQPVTTSLLEQADIVLVMEEAHRRSIFHLAPQHLGKVFLLSEMAGRHEDVTDPFGGSIEGYVKTVALLEELIDAGLSRILELIEATPARP